ncbi:MmcQ/YjbR family DNA-binding protein [Atopococcus tabaci]|uniref:MmcQ/YjbR family DNA-binding protein n=1 Tax=Atopococcus tabaci TaxID=269774 RepID=UPI00042786CC|nr:MmcQ/YjbR family DNA-binding protein [Atopococcus tabaci]
MKQQEGAFNMLTREEVFEYVRKNYGTEPDYPWKKFPQYAVLRHSSGSWYGIIMNVLPENLGLEGTDKIDILNLKCLPEINDSLRNGYNVFPGYHMNKEHWISLVLERTDAQGDVYNLIEQSFHLTK